MLDKISMEAVYRVLLLGAAGIAYAFVAALGGPWAVGLTGAGIVLAVLLCFAAAAFWIVYGERLRLLIFSHHLSRLARARVAAVEPEAVVLSLPHRVRVLGALGVRQRVRFVRRTYHRSHTWRWPGARGYLLPDGDWARRLDEAFAAGAA